MYAGAAPAVRALRGRDARAGRLREWPLPGGCFAPDGGSLKRKFHDHSPWD